MPGGGGVEPPYGSNPFPRTDLVGGPLANGETRTPGRFGSPLPGRSRSPGGAGHIFHHRARGVPQRFDPARRTEPAGEVQVHGGALGRVDGEANGRLRVGSCGPPQQFIEKTSADPGSPRSRVDPHPPDHKGTLLPEDSGHADQLSIVGLGEPGGYLERRSGLVGPLGPQGLIVLGLSRPSAAERHRVDLQRLQSKRPVAVSVGIGDPPDRHFGSGGSGRTRTGRHHDRTDAKVSPGDLKE